MVIYLSQKILFFLYCASTQLNDANAQNDSNPKGGPVHGSYKYSKILRLIVPYSACLRSSMHFLTRFIVLAVPQQALRVRFQLLAAGSVTKRGYIHLGLDILPAPVGDRKYKSWGQRKTAQAMVNRQINRGAAEKPFEMA